MEQTLSKSEKKRRAKGVEELVRELIKLSEHEIAALPCAADLRREIAEARTKKAGARKRLVKHIAKTLRKTDAFGPLFDFLAAHKGSKLKENRTFHALERLRDDIITEAIEAVREAEYEEATLAPDWRGESLDAAAATYPHLDQRAVATAALRYARTRKPAGRREVFRLLKAAHDHQQLLAQTGDS